jgi:DNA mismatch repair protein MutS
LYIKTSMVFELDKQTIKDLDIFGDGKSAPSVFSLFNYTKTEGGRNCLEKIMEVPLADISELNERKDAISYLMSISFDLKINASQFDFIDYYFRLNIEPLKNNLADALFNRVSNFFKPDNNYYLIQSGIEQLRFLFLHLRGHVEILDRKEIPSGLRGIVLTIRKFIEQGDFVDLFINSNKVSFISLNKLDNAFRDRHRKEADDFLSAIYLLDALTSVGKAAREKNLIFPEYVKSNEPLISLRKLYHPLLGNAVPYDFELSGPANLCFLTGPNMAGKSTFLKSVSLAVYISHLGFPIPAEKMTTSVYRGIITTINLSDNLSKGYSHFYSEVKRVKETALKLRETNHMFVVFDEMFRGTNVKDAFDATLLIIQSFVKIKKSTFLVSTHITEVAEKLRDNGDIEFKYFDSKLVGETPEYTYLLKDGVSHERLGMYIVKKEKIPEILNSIEDD